ncbi:MAG: flavin reductase family protein [Peptostreptococcaceae bacterium]|nr:flavin reductase family protein [Peptostreptococcaceae bacterium]
MGKVSFKPGTMLNPVPVVMVSCGSMEEKNILTIAWTGIINSEPPITYVSVRKSRYSHELIEKSNEFVINLCTEDLTKAVDFCGVKTGRNTDKFKEQKLTPVEGELVGCPMILESPVNLECKVIEMKSFPTHDMFIAEIVKVHVDEKLLNRAGKLQLEKAELICFNHGEYFGIKREAIGKFGYSIMKPNTKKRLENQKKTVKRVGKGKSGPR